MRGRKLASVATVAALLGVAMVALAKPPSKGTGSRGRSDGPTTPKDRAKEDAAPDGSAKPASSGATDDLGPPPSTSARPRGSAVSPLTPEANEFPSTERLKPLADYDALLGDIARLRGRVSALTRTLFSSKIRVVVHTGGAEESRVAAFRVVVDDGVVFAGKKGFVAREDRVVHESALAPGQHVLGLEVERQDARGPRFRSLQTNRFTVVVPDGKVLVLRADLVDYSDMERFPRDRGGAYDLLTRLAASVKDR